MKYEALSKYRYPCKLEKVVEPDANGTYHYYLVDVQNKIICSKLIKDEAEELRDILNREFVKAKEESNKSPVPNAEETNRIAAEYCKSGRTLVVEYYNTVAGEWRIAHNPTFNKESAWRIRPTKEEVLVEVYIDNDRNLSARVFGFEIAPNTWKLVGRVYCEVAL